jgi:hypothetical protein
MRNNKFWDVDDLLMSNEIVSCITETDILSFDFDQKSIICDNIIKEGNKIDVPLWFAILLRINNFVSIKQPKYLSDKFYNQLRADPTVVNFKSKSNYLYDICLKLIPFLDEELKWPKCFAFSMYMRYLYLYQNSTNVMYENQSIIKLSCLREKNFYEKMVKINRNLKFYLDNYSNNNNDLDLIVEAKRMTLKRKKFN